MENLNAVNNVIAAILRTRNNKTNDILFRPELYQIMMHKYQPYVGTIRSRVYHDDALF